MLALSIQALALHVSPRAPSLHRCSPPTCVAKGDMVRIVADVMLRKGTLNANGLVGEVIDVAGEPDAEEWGACCELAWGQPTLTVQLRQEGPLAYYARDELRKIHAGNGHMNMITEGDRVEVTSDVHIKGGVNSIGMQGTVIDTWEICETDPACCCAELTDTGYEVTVKLDHSTSPTAPSGEQRQPLQRLVGYFNEDEVSVVKEEQVVAKRNRV
jgi:hypothetical protein